MLRGISSPHSCQRSVFLKWRSWINSFSLWPSALPSNFRLLRLLNYARFVFFYVVRDVLEYVCCHSLVCFCVSGQVWFCSTARLHSLQRTFAKKVSLSRIRCAVWNFGWRKCHLQLWSYHFSVSASPTVFTREETTVRKGSGFVVICTLIMLYTVEKEWRGEGKGEKNDTVFFYSRVIECYQSECAFTYCILRTIVQVMLVYSTWLHYFYQYNQRSIF